MLKVLSIPFWNVPGYVYHDYHPPFCTFPFFTPLFAFHSAVVILATLKILLFAGEEKEVCFPTRASLICLEPKWIVLDGRRLSAQI